MQVACGKWGIRTPGTSYPARQFSKLLVSATHPTFLVSKRARLKSDTKLNYFCVKAKFFRINTSFFTFFAPIEDDYQTTLKYKFRADLLIIMNPFDYIGKDVSYRQYRKF